MRPRLRTCAGYSILLTQFSKEEHSTHLQWHHTPTSCDFPVIAWQKQIASPLIKAPNGAKAGEIDSN